MFEWKSPSTKMERESLNGWHLAIAIAESMTWCLRKCVRADFFSVDFNFIIFVCNWQVVLLKLHQGNDKEIMFSRQSYFVVSNSLAFRFLVNSLASGWQFWSKFARVHRRFYYRCDVATELFTHSNDLTLVKWYLLEPRAFCSDPSHDNKYFTATDSWTDKGNRKLRDTWIHFTWKKQLENK